MRKTILMVAFAAFFITLSTAVQAQKFAFIDTQYILDNIPQYKAAQQQLDQISANWQKEIEAKYAVIDKLYKDFQAEQILLTDEMKKKREQEIVDKEKEVKERQKAKYGYQGELVKRKQELVKPIQEKVYNAVKKLATDQSFAIIFDKSSDLTILYANPKYDKSDEVLTNLGYKPGSKSATQGGEKTPGSGTPGGGDTPRIDKK